MRSQALNNREITVHVTQTPSPPNVAYVYNLLDNL